MQLCWQPLQESCSMKSFVLVSVIATVWLVGCSSNDSPNRNNSAQEQARQNQDTTPANASQPTRSSQRKDTTPKLLAGDTLERWRARIKNLDPAEPQTTETVEGLIKLVDDPHVPWITRRQAAHTLGRIGVSARRAVPLLIHLLDEKEPRDQQPAPCLWAIKAIALFGPVAAKATPALAEILNNETARFEHRASTIDALARIGTAHPLAIASLINALAQRPAHSTNEAARDANSLRELAANGIDFVGPAAASAIPALIRATRDENESVRRKATLALGAMGPRAEIAMPALVDLLGFDESAAVRDAAAKSLAGVGAAAVSPLKKLLTDEDPAIRWRAAMALGQLRRLAISAVPALRDATADVSPIVRMESIEALWHVTGKADVVLPGLLETLTVADRQVRIRAFRLLVQLGPQALPAAGPLRRLLKDDRSYVRQVAKKSLQTLEIEENVAQDPGPANEQPKTSP
jgi:HEAT repeat protein